MSDIIARDGIRAFLLQVLQAETGIVLNANEVSFSELTLVDASVTTYDDPDKRNTQVRIKKEASGGNPEVSVLLRYNRLSLSKLFTFRSATLTLNPSFTSVHEYLPALNTRLGTALTAEDVENSTLTGAAQSFTLRAPESSFYAFGSLSVSLVEEQVPEPEEEDEMYYTLIPPELQNTLDDSAKRMSVQIGSGCGYPMFLKSSDPMSLNVKNLKDIANLSELVLEEGHLFFLAGTNQPDLITNERSGYNYGGGEYMPHSGIAMRQDSEYQIYGIGQFEIDAANTNNDRLGFVTKDSEPVNGVPVASWYDAYASAGGTMLMWHGRFSHPAVLDAKGNPAKIYWKAVVPLDLSSSQPVEEDDVYFHLIASDMSYTVDDANRIINLRIGALDNSVSDSYLVSSDQTQFGAIALKANFGDLSGLTLQEGYLYAVGSETPAVFQQHFTQTGQYADPNVMPSSASYIQQGGLAQTREIGLLAQDVDAGDPQNIKLYSDGTNWYDNYPDYNGKYLLIRARFAHSNYNKPDGTPIPVWYNGVIKLTLDNGEVPQA